MFIYMCAGYFYIAALRTFLGITWETSVMVTGKKKKLLKLLTQHASPCVALATLNCR